jgi:probable phosphoglycerate mutase
LSLHLLRHGETAFSRQDRFCGGIDAELTSAGHQMARAFADGFSGADLRWQAIHTSTRRRAIDSAAPLAARVGLTPRREAGLDEICHGDWQGRAKSEIARDDPARYHRWLQDPTAGAPGGESVFEVAERAMDVVGRIIRQHREGDVLIVAHKTVLRVLTCALLRIDLRRYRDRILQPVGGHTVIDFEGGLAVPRLLGDVSHLPVELRALALGAPPPTPTRLPLFEPQSRGDLIGEQEAGRRQPDGGQRDVEPAGAQAAFDGVVAPFERIAPVAEPVGLAIDAVDGA